MGAKKLLPVFFVVLTMACGLFSQAAPGQATPTAAPSALQATPTLLPSATQTLTPLPGETASATQTLTPLPGETASATPPSSIPPFLTSIPGIGATLTAVYSTPGFQETLAAQQTTIATAVGAQIQGLSSTLLSQCPNPSDPPLQMWVDVPVMPQATAGQAVQTLVGSYYCFRAPVTVQAMETFYKSQLQSPNWVMQSDTNGQMIFVGLTQSGAQFLTLSSGAGSKNDLIVAINVTNPLQMPTPKP